MILLTFPNNHLTTPSKPFDFANFDAKQLEQDMIKIMLDNKGIGLAANQVGLQYRILVISPQNLQNKEPFAIINPDVVNVSTEVSKDLEGCLSFPDLWLEVSRPRWVDIKYLDSNAQIKIVRFEDLDARCVLHEIEHLDGICFTNHVSKLKLDIAIKKQRKIRNGRTKSRITNGI